ncbi:glycosyltransferase family 2 protein [Actinospongicola halichondriae]|uniref:glycosyltransferase family 2 protein n=1 Tax=Actinospongicola halichondriae TaxID=3236844 RepID=UPI003D398AC6
MSAPASGDRPVSIVVIHRNRPERLRSTIQALADQTVAVRIILVDSGSTPENHALAVAMLPADAEVVQMGGNGGFGPSANAGWRTFLAGHPGEWVGLCPHDALPAADAVERILDAVADRPRAGLACGDFGDGTTPVVDPYFGGIQVPATVTEGWDPAGYPHGTLLFARRGFLEDVGLFDEDYFAYCEEADLGLRAHAAGWEVGLVRGARVYNPDMSNTMPVVDYLMVRNTLILVRRWSGRYKVFIRFVMALYQVVTERESNPYHDTRARLLALRDFVLGRVGPPPDALTRVRPAPQETPSQPAGLGYDGACSDSGGES